jgi:hypothetical protein
MSQTITATSPWIKRFNAYLQERFPLLNGLLFFIFYLTAFTYTAFLANPAAPVELNTSTFIGFLGVYSFFFRLRVFDEHKDYLKDLLNYPNRVLQTGLVTLAQLRNIAVGGIFLEALISLRLSWAVLGFWVIAFGYSLLMAKEFFVGQWLEKRLFFYAFSHLLIMPLLVVWVGAMAAPAGKLPSGIVWLGILSLLSGLAFEVSRKIRAPWDEVATIPTYSQLWGTRRAPLIALAVLGFASLLMGLLLRTLEASWPFYGGIVVLFLACAALFRPFLIRPETRNAKKLELASSLFMLAAYLCIIIAVLSQTGVRWN